MTTYVMCPQFGAGVQFFDLNGDPLSGGKLYTYLAGTTTPADTWTSHLANVFNSNPIILDAAGRVVEEIWIDVSLQYKFILTNSVNVQIWSHDFISFYVAPDLDLIALANAVDPTKGDALIGYQQSNAAGVLAGAVSKTVHDKLQEVVSVKDFGAKGDGTTDDTDAIILATVSTRCVYFPAGTYVVTRPLEFTGMFDVSWVGASAPTVIIKPKKSVAFLGPLLTVTSGPRWSISNITFYWDDNTSFGAPTGQGLLWLREMTDLQFTNNIVVHGIRGLFLRACKYVLVDGNKFELVLPAVTENYSLHVSDIDSDANSLSEFVTVTNNIWTGSGSFFAGRSFIISGNNCSGSKFGAGINTWSSNTKQYISHVITNNICRDNIGADEHGPVRGMEILGQYHQVSNNQCHGNGGPGIAWFAFKSICSNNICWNNGTEPTGTPGQKAGIFAIAGADVLARPQGSLVIGNHCFSAGAYQGYGFVETEDIDFMVVSGNNFTDNLVAETLLNPANTQNTYDLDEWFSFVPDITSTTGTITTLGTINCEYQQRGLLIFFTVTFVIVTNGTGAGEIKVTLPVRSRAVLISQLVGRGSDNKSLVATIGPTSLDMSVVRYDGTYPGADGRIITVSGSYAR